MKKSTDLLTIQDLCNFYGLSEQTIRRRIRESREGAGSFPRPVFGYGRKALWHRNDIISWRETKPEQSEQDG